MHRAQQRGIAEFKTLETEKVDGRQCIYGRAELHLTPQRFKCVLHLNVRTSPLKNEAFHCQELSQSTCAIQSRLLRYDHYLN